MNITGQLSPYTGLKSLVAAIAVAASGLSHAAVRVGDSSLEAVAAGNTPELMLVIWDPVKEVSYTRDLGLLVYSENYAAGNTGTNLFVYGQQDAGYQKLFDPLNTDTNFQTFLATSNNIANQVWAVIAVSSDPNKILETGGRTIFTTLNAATPTGTTNPQYTHLIDWQQSELDATEGSLEGLLRDISSQCTGAGCTTNFNANLSTFNVKGQLQYAGQSFNTNGSFNSSTSAPGVFNAVNRSSWFYALNLGSDNGFDLIVVDEFDNLGHDAYWGLGVDANNNYILSYTIDAVVTPTRTAAGATLRLRTDYAASYGHVRLIDAAVPDAILPGGAVTAVPEPVTWGLMGLGLAVLTARARRRA